MLVAAIDCATAMTCVGWIEVDDNTGQPLRFAEIVAPARPGHAETLLERLRQALATGGHDLAAPGLFAYGRGPGTFTGLRIGLASIKGLCVSSGAALRGISSLEALALGCPRAGLVAPVFDARRGELFAGLYRVSHDEAGIPNAQVIWPERVGTVSEVLAQLATEIGDEPAVILGSGIVAHSKNAISVLPTQVVHLGEAFVAPRPLWLGMAGYRAFTAHGADDLDSVEPVYLREPDARLPKPPVWARGPAADS
jgi:tRNA threonylcarbamoyladenosine biosynthesis protein TsaB